MSMVIFKKFETAMSSTIVSFSDVSNDNQEQAQQKFSHLSLMIVSEVMMSPNSKGI